jgi:hypothetical protein
MSAQQVPGSRVRRALAPSLNPTGLGSAAAAVYAAVVMIWNATHHHGVINPEVIVAAIGAAAFLYTRFKVTPVADPKDGNGAPLLRVPLAQVPLTAEAEKVAPAPPPVTPPQEM